MNNAEKFAEVFGVDLPIKVSCLHEYGDHCRTCTDIATCLSWATTEYKEKEYDHRYISKADGERLQYDLMDYLAAMPEIPKSRKYWGEIYQSLCPCGGTLTATRSTYNGHIRCTCDKCGFRMIE